MALEKKISREHTNIAKQLFLTYVPWGGKNWERIDMTTLEPTRQHMKISSMAFANETDILREVADACPRYEKLLPKIQAEATRLVEKLRKEGTGIGVEAFLQEYGLNTQEGIAIMSLAEALLRVPDEHTVDELIRDKFEGRRWDDHIGKSESLLVNASSWGLLLTGKVLEFSMPDGTKPSNILKKVIGRVGEPTVREALRQAVKFIGTQFVMGTDIKEAMKRARAAEKRGYCLSYDILGEGARTQEQADAYFAAYKDAIIQISKRKTGNPPSLSIKLSALHPRYYLAKRDRLVKELLPRLRELISLAKESELIVSIDAEESYRLDIHMLVFQALLEDKQFDGMNNIGFVLQAYQLRAFYVIDWLKRLSEKTGHRIPVRLVKGAYWDTEIKMAQVAGIEGYPVFTRKSNTDVSYIACAEKLLSHRDAFYPQFATHNALSLAAVREIAADAGWKVGEYEFQRLHGMGEKLYDQLIGDTPCRIYAPVGRHKDLLAYLIRRLLENGANSSFVNQLMDERVPVAEILRDPLGRARERGFIGHPDIPLPVDLYNDRKNSPGYELGNLSHQEKVTELLEPWLKHEWVFGNKDEATPVVSPTDGHPVGAVENAKEEDAKKAVDQARDAFENWNRTPVNQRAAMLERAADLFEKHYGELMALCIREAGKTLSDTIAEVREAIDFLRYYAIQARRLMVPQIMPGPTGESNELYLHGRGPYVCISPWNFPLAIFTGQVAAALVTGNTVLAKPAEQTPLIASRAVELMHEAGIPKDVLQIICGTGETVGPALTNHPDIAGVCFTGSVPTAKAINRALANRDGAIVPLIAETGGQNAMIVDSTALLEQAVDDILLSAFGSAGQRCSALRVLYVQDSVADELLEMVKAAMSELTIGDPIHFDTDVGPVIDTDAQEGLLSHINDMQEQAAPLKGLEAPKSGTYVAPHAFELQSIEQLEKEHFGPILHVIRFKAEELEGLPDRINSTNFGLTFGLHSRIEDHWEYMQERVRVGNCYINRNITGAVVGVQPFGGEGISGTGPKAGGPYYLLRFVGERTVTINTAAIGGNLELLSNRPGIVKLDEAA